MTRKLSDADYMALEERVKNGKKHLDGRWSKGREVCPKTQDYEQYCIDIWFDLSDMLFDQMKLRGLFRETLTFEQVKAMQENTLERVREQMIAKGLIKRPKERRTRKVDDQSRSTINNLFEPS